MARLSQIVSLGLALSALPTTLAGPACAKKNFQAADCVSKCQSNWGWTGAMMNTDRWGSVVKKTDTTTEWASVIAEACGVAITSTAAPSATSGTASTETAIPAPAAAAGTNPSLQSSDAVSSASTLSAVSATPSATPSSTSASFSIASSSSSSSKPATTSSAVQTQGFIASTRSRLVTSTIARPTTSSAVEEQQPKTSSTKQAQPTSSAAAAANTPAPASDSTGSSGGTSDADIQAYLDAHNTVRAQHGAAPLTWSDNAASKAQQWANNCVFQHSGGTLGPFGENLAAGTGSSYGIAAAIKSWTDEVSQYNPSNPVASHFTQVVWKGTSQVGCAVQSCSGIFAASFGPAKFFVCEYSAQGNIIGEFTQNVQV